MRENRAVHAVARLLLHGRIHNIQTSWVKLADAGGGVGNTGNLPRWSADGDPGNPSCAEEHRIYCFERDPH